MTNIGGDEGARQAGAEGVVLREAFETTRECRDNGGGARELPPERGRSEAVRDSETSA